MEKWNFNEGILITNMTDKEMNTYIEKAAAIVTEEEWLHMQP